MITRRQVLRRGSAVGLVTLADGASRASAASFAALTPTSVQTGDYTAAPGDFVPVDVSGGSVTITLPTAPADQAQVGVKAIALAVPFDVTVACGGSDVLDKTGGPSSLTLDSLNEGVLLQYQASTQIWYAQADFLSLDVAGGAAKLGSDGTVGGPSGSALSSSVALVSAPNVFVAAADADVPITVRPHSPTATGDVFVMTDSSGHPIVYIEPTGRLQLNDTLGNDHDQHQAGLNIDRKWHAISMKHSVDWSSQSNGGNDLEDSTHRSQGDCHFMTHLGGLVPDYSFTANSDGAGNLSSVSGFDGLYGGAVFNGPSGEVLTVTAVNVQAGTLSYSGTPVPSGSGLAFSYSTPTDAGTGGDGTLNLEVPYWLDHISGNAGSAPPGGILNNRTGQTQILAQVQPVAVGQPAYNLSYQSNSQAIRILNAFTHGGSIPVNGKNIALQVQNFSSGNGIAIEQQTAPTNAALVITDNAGIGHPMLRVNDSSGNSGFQLLSDGTFQAGLRPSTTKPRAAVRDYVAGISETLRLYNSGAASHNANGDGVGLTFASGGAGTTVQAKIQGVLDASSPTNLGSLRFIVLDGRSGDVERLRISSAGIGFFTKVATPAAQQTGAGVTANYKPGTGTAVTIDGAFQGASGSSAYTIGDIVTALKAYGLLA